MPLKSKQKTFFSSDKRRAHGGELSQHKRKVARPLSTKLSLHLVLRSDHAKGYRSLNNNSQIVKAVVRKAAGLFRIKVYSQALNHNHIHLSVRGKSREDLQNFFRVVAGHIAQQILRKYPLPKKAGNAPVDAKKYKRKFWNELLYSRMVTWGREFKIVLNYILKNEFEASGQLMRRTGKKTRSSA